MRYQSFVGNIGETVYVPAKFLTGATVTTIIYNLKTLAVVPTTTGATSEIPGTGIFIWASTDFVTQPITETQFVAQFTDNKGQRASQKFVVGGFPDQIAFAEYGSTVYFDSASSNTGTTFPTGTLRAPVNNEADMRTIADALGVKQFNIVGTCTLSQTYNGYRFYGGDPLSDTVAFNSQNVDGCTFGTAQLSGTIGSGDISALNCVLNNVVDFSGVALESTFLLGLRVKPAGGGLPSLIFRCLSNIAAFGDLNLNFNATASDVIIRDYNGDVNVSNMSNAGASLALAFGSGNLTLAASCTAGAIEVAGNCEVVNASAGTTVTDNTINRLVSHRPGVVFLNTSTGSDANTGTEEGHVQTWARAKAVATERDLHVIQVEGSLTLTSSATNFIFRGDSRNDSVDINGQDVDGSVFENVNLSGASLNTNPLIQIKDCLVGTVSNITGNILRSEGIGAMSVGAGLLTLNDFVSVLGYTFDMTNASALVRGSELAGVFAITNSTNFNLVDLGFINGTLDIQASNTNGTLTTRGFCNVTNNGSMTWTDQTIVPRIRNQAVAPFRRR